MKAIVEANAGPPASANAHRTGTVPGGKFLTFRLHGEEFGVEILRVVEIIGVLDITIVPHTQEFVRGVINLRGKVIPVIDLRSKFGMPETTYNDQIIDLPEFILQNRERFVLKPNDDYTGKGIFFGSEMDASGWERALREAMRTPYVVQERVEFARAVFPLSTWGQLEFREMRVDVHPHAYLGKVMGCSSWLTGVNGGSFSTITGLAPTYILQSRS